MDATVRPGTGEADRLAVAVRRDPDREPGREGLDHHAAADHQADMARRRRRTVSADEEDEIPRLDIGGGDLRAPPPLHLRRARDVDPSRPVRLHHQPGAIEGIRPGPAPLVRLAQLLLSEGDRSGCPIVRCLADTWYAGRRAVHSNRADREAA